MLRSIQWEKRVDVPPAELLRSLVRPACIAALMFALMHAPLLMRAAPLAPALMAAGLPAGESAAALAAGCLLGMLRLPLRETSLLPAISCALVLLAELLNMYLPRLQRVTAEARISFSAGLAALLPAMVLAGGEPINSLQAFACGALAACSAPFLYALLQLENGRRRLSFAEKTGCALVLGGTLAALEGTFSPAAQACAALLVLAFPGFAPASGILAGLALAAGGGGPMKIASLSLCALACSRSLFPQRWQRSMALCAAAALGQLLGGARALDFRWALFAGAAYPLLPPALAGRLEEISLPPRIEICDPGRIAQEATVDARRRISALAGAFFDMAEPSALPPDVPDEQELIQQMRTRLCSGCVRYGDCWAGGDNRAVRLLCRLIGDALERTDAPLGQRTLFADGEIPPDVLRICRRGRMIPDRLGLLLRDFAQRRQSEIKRCETNRLLGVQLMQAGEILTDLARTPEPAACPDALTAALEGAGLGCCTALPLQKGNLALLKREPWSREEATAACTAAGRSLRARFLPSLQGSTLRLVRAPKLAAETGSSCQSGIPGAACGDSHLAHMLDERRLMLAISDGMGSGEAASAESLEALRLLRSFLEAGISRPLALETVNQQLLMRSGEEIYATLDLCIIDLDSGTAELTKLAACRTILLRGRQVLRIEGGCLPLGILENVQGSVRQVRLQPSDLLVMGSDGVMEAGEPLLIEHLLQENAHLPPEQLAEQLVRQAGLSRDPARRDDLTCICVRIHAE